MIFKRMCVLCLSGLLMVGVNAQMSIPGVCGFLDQVTALSEEPRVFLVEHLLTDEECDHLIARASPKLKRSTVVSNELKDGSVNQLDEARTSQGMFLEKPTYDPILKRVEKKIAQLTGLPEANGEGMQILYYNYGAEYRPHYDFFDKDTAGGAACYNRGGQRVASLIIYLSSTEEGGETIFPYADISVSPVKGNAVLFYNCLPNGEEDAMSFHGSAPVVKGEKWVAVKWLRQGTFY